MSNPERKGQRLAALSMLGALVFNFPVLALFNVPGALFGIPLLYAYVFLAWALLIALVAFVVDSDD
jgi:hypothetical protein